MTFIRKLKEGEQHTDFKLDVSFRLCDIEYKINQIIDELNKILHKDGKDK